MIRQMEVAELKKILDKDSNAVLIDVREEGEYRDVRAPRAQLLALSEFDPSEVSDNMKIPKDQTIYLICKSGGRSMRAAQLLEEVGYKDIVNIAGGTTAWVHSGFETKNG
jgi:rhodanese-related sulfurtransferase